MSQFYDDEFEKIDEKWTISRGDIVQVTEQFLKNQNNRALDSSITLILESNLALRNLVMLMTGESGQQGPMDETTFDKVIRDSMKSTKFETEDAAHNEYNRVRTLLRKHRDNIEEYNRKYLLSRWRETHVVNGDEKIIRKKFFVQDLISEENESIPVAERRLAVLINGDDRTVLPLLWLEKIGTSATQEEQEYRKNMVDAVRTAERVQNTTQMRAMRSMIEQGQSLHNMHKTEQTEMAASIIQEMQELEKPRTLKQSQPKTGFFSSLKRLLLGD